MALEVCRGGAWRSNSDLDEAVCDLLDCLLPLVARPGALAIAQLGQSLDGRIATETGASHYINGLASRVHLHRLRALVDAVLVGAGTVAADDPQLTVRHVEGRHPCRVILDPRGRLPASRVVFQDGLAATWHLVGRGVPPLAGVGAHVRHLELDVPPGDIAPATILAALAAEGLPRVLIEGGGITVSRFLDADVLHRLHVLMAPLLIGSGRPGLTLPAIDTLDRARRPPMRHFVCGEDLLLDLALADAAPPAQQTEGTGQAGQQHQQAVGHGDRHALGGGQADQAPDQCGGAFAQPPAGD
ncbi:RibD family protein [Modicisalibacter sp. 'Wilcox']|uniref:RibD family protein n=1 Tax=Modicisalibacter sp. 'Wilcox' TaxID=2679914 RepID=UPI001F096D77|nr:RibD family protein [Modicisalibacter sp. 'Wilcox']